MIGCVLLLGPALFTPLSPEPNHNAPTATGTALSPHLTPAAHARPVTGVASSEYRPDANSGPGPSPPEGTSETRTWPVTGPAGARPSIARPWLPPPTPWAAGHRGVDLVSRAGATVRAAAPGRVSFAGKVADRGVLSIELPGSGRPPLRITYEPVRPTVRKGDRVRAGQPVAVLQPGPYHCDTPCLHWGLRRGRTYLDPLSLLVPPSPRLLPVFHIPEPTPPPTPRTPSPETPPLSPTAAGAPALATATALAAIATWSHSRLRPQRSRRPAPSQQHNERPLRH
ncbi:murein hydrolase activator EnvC family protein [Streptomyces violens]|uniref:murein hydrolase activator EnvC family protein n=1 Tax=Streptomyces violens TaxID=66377 RepID=UPI0009966FE2|nr:M23 family metallopeptidase [Streptomyces violens]